MRKSGHNAIEKRYRSSINDRYGAKAFIKVYQLYWYYIKEIFCPFPKISFGSGKLSEILYSFCCPRHYHRVGMIIFWSSWFDHDSMLAAQKSQECTFFLAPVSHQQSEKFNFSPDPPRCLTSILLLKIEARPDYCLMVFISGSSSWRILSRGTMQRWTSRPFWGKPSNTSDSCRCLLSPSFISPFRTELNSSWAQTPDL